MKVVLTGATGQLGKEIIKQIPKGFDLIPLGRDKLDLSSYDDCCQYIKIEKPDWIINAGAYTSVDKAEYEKEEALLEMNESDGLESLEEKRKKRKKRKKKKKSASRTLSKAVKKSLDKKADRRCLTRGSVYAEFRAGLGAYYSSGSRRGMSAHQWAHARVNSANPSKSWARVKKRKKCPKKKRSKK